MKTRMPYVFRFRNKNEKRLISIVGFIFRPIIYNEHSHVLNKIIWQYFHIKDLVHILFSYSMIHLFLFEIAFVFCNFTWNWICLELRKLSCFSCCWFLHLIKCFQFYCSYEFIDLYIIIQVSFTQQSTFLLLLLWVQFFIFVPFAEILNWNL